VLLFGGHVFTQFLLAFDLETDGINCILDNSPLKHNKRLYGSRLVVRKPQDVLTSNGSDEEERTVVVLKVAGYFDEIKEQLISLCPNVELWV